MCPSSAISLTVKEIDLRNLFDSVYDQEKNKR